MKQGLPVLGVVVSYLGGGCVWPHWKEATGDLGYIGYTIQFYYGNPIVIFIVSYRLYFRWIVILICD